MNPRRKKLLDRIFDDIVNYAYASSHPELPDNPDGAFKRYRKILEAKEVK